MRGHDVPILIACRDRLTVLDRLVRWLETAGYTNLVLVDNASSYPPLCDYLKHIVHPTILLEENLGPSAIWKKQLVSTVAASQDYPGFYVVTDCDVLPEEACPPNALEHFHDLLLKYPQVNKVGFGLRIDDLPHHFQYKCEVETWEAQFWQKTVEPHVYDASIDTTFALYRPQPASPNFYRGLRTGAPYRARHLPWYANSSDLSEEDRYYRSRCLPNITSWDRDTLTPSLSHAIEKLRK